MEAIQMIVCLLLLNILIEMVIFTYKIVAARLPWPADIWAP